MKPDLIDMELEAALARPMSADQRGWLDRRVATIIAQPRTTRRVFRLTRSTVLAIGLSLALAASFGVWAGQRATEAPYGMQSAASYEAERSAAMADTPLPPGATWQAWLSEPADASAGYGVFAGQSEVEYSAACLWFAHWLDEHEHGTTAGRSAALDGVLQMRTWQTFSDPQVNRSIDYFEGLLRAAERGDTAPIRAEVATNCTN
jgi:hypothetical protein